MIIVTDNATHEETLSQLLQTNILQFEIGVTILTGYNDIFIVTNKTKKYIFISVFEAFDYTVIRIPPRAYKIASLNDEFKRTFKEEEYVTEEDYPLKIKRNSVHWELLQELCLVEDSKLFLYKTIL